MSSRWRAWASVSAGLVVWVVGEWVPMPYGLARLHRQLEQAHLEQRLGEQQLVTLRGFERRQRELQAALEAGQRQLALLEQALPEQSELDGLLFQLQDAAHASGVTLRRIAARPVLPRPDHYEMPFEVELDGSYYALEQFFYRLSLEPRLINVSDIHLTGLSQPAKYPIAPGSTVNGTLTLIAFYRGPSAGPPTPAGSTAARGGRR